MQEQLFLHNT